MALQDYFYRDGTITVTNGSDQIVGTGTAWELRHAAGAILYVGSDVGFVDTVEDETHATLVDPWAGATTTTTYTMWLVPAEASQNLANNQRLSEIIQSLTAAQPESDILSAIDALAFVTDSLIVATGPTTFRVASKLEFSNGAEYDKLVNTLAARATYDLSPIDFRVLVADIGDGRAAIYSKLSAASADWSEPAFVTGPPGSFQSEGTWSAATTYEDAQVVYYQGSSWISLQDTNINHAPPTLPTEANAWWQILVRKGDGFTFRGTYSGATAYLKDDVVVNQNSGWIALQATTGNAPPTLPTTSNAQWQVLALGKTGVWRGDYAGGDTYIVGDTVLFNNSTWIAIAPTTGNAPPALPTTVNTWWQLQAAKGVGDVNGPASSVANNLVVFSDTTGKNLADSGVAAFTALQDNLIINPVMQISEQNGNTAGTSTLYYAADQWRASYAFAGVVSFGRVASKTPRGSRYRLRATVTTADASVAAGDVYAIQQLIEGNRIANLGWDGATGTQLVLRFGFKGPAGTYSAFYKNGGNTRSYTFNFTVSVANTDMEVVAVIPPDATGGVWPSDETLAASVGVCLMAGTTFTTAPNAWASGNFLGTTGTFNALGTVGNVVELFDVGLYPDPNNTGKPPALFIHPKYDEDLFSCQRYYHRFSSVGTSAAIGGASGVFVSATSIRVVMSFSPPMRTYPTAAFSAAADFQFVGVSSFTASAISAASASPNTDCLVIEATVAGATAGQGCYMRSANANAVIALHARM